MIADALVNYGIGVVVTALALWIYLKLRGDSLTPLEFAGIVLAWPISWVFIGYLRRR